MVVVMGDCGDSGGGGNNIGSRGGWLWQNGGEMAVSTTVVTAIVVPEQSPPDRGHSTPGSMNDCSRFKTSKSSRAGMVADKMGS